MVTISPMSGLLNPIPCEFFSTDGTEDKNSQDSNNDLMMTTRKKGENTTSRLY